MTGRPRSQDTATRPCPNCGAPTLPTQLVGGQRAALQVTADARPLPLDQALAQATNSRLVWCLIQRAGGGHRLTWYHPSAHNTSPHPHVLDHRCPRPPPAPSTTAAQQPHLF